MRRASGSIRPIATVASFLTICRPIELKVAVFATWLVVWKIRVLRAQQSSTVKGKSKIGGGRMEERDLRQKKHKGEFERSLRCQFAAVGLRPGAVRSLAERQG